MYRILYRIQLEKNFNDTLILDVKYKLEPSFSKL